MIFTKLSTAFFFKYLGQVRRPAQSKHHTSPIIKQGFHLKTCIQLQKNRKRYPTLIQFKIPFCPQNINTYSIIEQLKRAKGRTFRQQTRVDSSIVKQLRTSLTEAWEC